MFAFVQPRKISVHRRDLRGPSEEFLWIDNWVEILDQVVLFAGEEVKNGDNPMYLGILGTGNAGLVTPSQDPSPCTHPEGS